MTHRLLTVLPVAVLLAACPAKQPESQPALFAEGTIEEREAAIHAAIGTGPALAFVAMFALEQDALTSVQEEGCLEVELLAESPPEVQITADACVGASGTEWNGVAIAENASLVVELLEAVDGDLELMEGPMRLEYRDFSMGTDGESLVFDGTIEQTSMVAGAPYRSDIALTVDFGALAFRTDASYDCEYQDDAAYCDFVAGSTGAVPELGSFEISGGFTLGGSEAGPSGKIVLKGADELVLDLGDIDDEGCAAVLIDDAEVQRFCMDLAPVEPAPTAEIVSGGIGCSTDAWYLDATVDGEDVAEMRAMIYFDDGAQVGTEVHAMPFVETNDLGDFHQVEVAIDESYVAGESSTVACETDDLGVTSADVLLEALDADGEVVACLAGGQGGRVPASACENTF